MIGSILIVSQVGSHASNDNSLWHMHLGQKSEREMEILSKQGLLGNHKVEHLQFSKHCIYGKQYKMKFLKVVLITKATLDYVHSDCWGSSRVPFLGGARYLLSIIDDYS